MRVADVALISLVVLTACSGAREGEGSNTAPPRIAASSSPIRTALEHLGIRDPGARVTIVRLVAPGPEGGDVVRVAVTEDGLPDDSIVAQRHMLRLRREGARWVVASERTLQRCQPGRGHQVFSSQPCV
jgi:hypothetical protein